MPMSEKELRRARYRWARVHGGLEAPAAKRAAVSMSGMVRAFPGRDFPPELVTPLRIQNNVYGPRHPKVVERARRYHELKALGADADQATEGKVSEGPFRRIEAELLARRRG